MNIFYKTVSAVPTAGAVAHLHLSYKNKLLNSLIKLIEYASQELNVDYANIQDKLDFCLSDSKYLSPLVYYKYFNILYAMENQDIENVKKNIASFSELKIEDIRLNSFVIEPGLQKSWEHEIFINESKISFGDLPIQAQTPSDNCFNKFEESIRLSLELIYRLDPTFYEEIDSLVSHIKLIESNDIVGSTSPKFFGAIYISLPIGLLKDHPILHFMEHIIHETSHLYLNTIISYDKLVLNDPYTVFDAPIRTDKRPMLGIYHATFVLSRMIRIFKMLHVSKLYFDNDMVAECINDFTNKYQNGCNTIRLNAELTELGRRIFESTKECADVESYSS